MRSDLFDSSVKRRTDRLMYFGHELQNLEPLLRKFLQDAYDSYKKSGLVPAHSYSFAYPFEADYIKKFVSPVLVIDITFPLRGTFLIRLSLSDREKSIHSDVLNVVFNTSTKYLDYVFQPSKAHAVFVNGLYGPLYEQADKFLSDMVEFLDFTAYRELCKNTFTAYNEDGSRINPSPFILKD